MDKNQNTLSYEDDKSDSVNRSANDKMIDFPTCGNSTQFKIDSGYVNNPFLQNRNSHYKNLVSASEERTIKVQIFLNIEFNFNGKMEMLKITQDVPPQHMTIDDVITLAISEFNTILEERGTEHRINPNQSIWNLYMSKKNGKPKQDLPALDRDNLLQDTQEDMFSLDTKDANKLWNENSDEWVEYQLKEDGEEDYTKNQEPVKETKQTNNENKQTQINQEVPIKSAYKSSVSKIQKHKNESTKVCNFLCFSK